MMLEIYIGLAISYVLILFVCFAGMVRSPLIYSEWHDRLNKVNYVYLPLIWITWLYIMFVEI